MSASVFAPATPTPGSIKGVYAHLDCLVEGIDQLKKAGFTDMVVTAPLPRHEIEELIYEGRPSPVRWFTLTGALFGAVGGFSVCSLTHLNWPMIIPAGKPLVSIPAFMVITFEATVLMGCLFTLVGLLTMCRLPANNLQVEVTDPRFSDDKFGLVLNGLVPADAARVRRILSETGAIELSGMDQEAAHA
jgi:molybdopterin-containing oxidoreductase family membrane subunit